MKQLSEKAKWICQIVYGKTVETSEEMFALALERLDSTQAEQKKTD